MDKWELQHRKNINAYSREIEDIYNSAIREAAVIGANIADFNPSKPFTYKDYPQTKKRIETLLIRLNNGIESTVLNGVKKEWELANVKNNYIVNTLFASSAVSQAQTTKYFTNSLQAQQAFIARRDAGLDLSDRVWKYTEQFKQEIEMGLDLGIREGLSAAQMARDLKQYLQQPDKLFRRVRDEHGQLQLSKNAKAYNPGAGVYRSSYQNALRLTKNETNMAYRSADHERWKHMDFILGIEIFLSGSHPREDICDELAGQYPKDFKFVGWHVGCLCIATPILPTTEEYLENADKKNPQYEGVVKDVPENFKKWVEDNKERIEKANNKGTLPYFLKDNEKFTGVEVKNINTEEKANILQVAMTKYDSYSEEWEKVYFDEKTGGFNVYHKDHEFQKAGGGGEAEKKVGEMLAKYNGKQVEFQAEKGIVAPDLKFDCQTWDVKYINDANEKTIRSYIENVRRKGAENGIFYWEKINRYEDLHAAFESEIGKMIKKGRIDEMPNIYYMDLKGILKLLWKK
jgi:hypothetical protein